MKKILINDGIHTAGKERLINAGFQVETDHIPQEELMVRLSEYDAICVRSATKVRADLIDTNPKLSLIGRGGVGLDNIDVAHAKAKGIAVINTPAASSRSVAELVFAHMLSASRFVYQANREMPEKGSTAFKALKKSYAGGVELGGKTLGVIGFGRIGQETAKIGLGMSMNVVAMDMIPDPVTLTCNIGGQEVHVPIEKRRLDFLLEVSDYISIHTPFTGEPIIGEREFDHMKDGVILVNASRGGTVDEMALMEALKSGKVAHAGLDVFADEPAPNPLILTHPKISLTPHIGAATGEAQERIGLELADQIITHFNV